MPAFVEYFSNTGSARRVLRAMAKLYVLLAFCVVPQALLAQPTDSFSVAETVEVADPEVAYGDVILYDDTSGLYRLSQNARDPRVFGIVVEDAALLLETDPELVPVVQGGRVPVNVTLENGAIETGDPLVTSSVPGKAMRADERRESVFGFATEDFGPEDAVESTNEDGETVLLGTISAQVGGGRLQAFFEENEVAARQNTDQDTSAGTVVRFSVAALVALASVFVTFYTFLASIRSGVTSVGRNPRAKAAVRSMVILNIVLALIITIAGIFFAISLLVVRT